MLLITGAALGDRLGRRRLFAVGLGIFVAASAASALAPNVTVLIAARAVQGVGAALVAPLSLALLSAAFPPERRGWALGLYSGITGLAVLGGPVIGGAVTQGLAWQWVFWLNVPIGLAAIPVILRRIEESYGPRARLDVIGLALVTASTFGIVWGLMRANDAGWGSFEVIGSLAGGIVALIAFVAVELRTREPMLPMRLFSSRSFSAGSATNFLLSSALFGAVFFMAQFLQISLGNGPLASGLRLLPWTGCLFIVAPIAGSLVDRIGERPLIVLGLTLQAIGFGWVALIATAGLAYWEMVPPLMIAGAGDLDVDSRRPERGRERGRRPDEIGKASGTFATMRQLGGVFGVALAVAVFSGAGSYASPQAFASGFSPALWVSAAFSLAGALVAIAIPARRALRPTAVSEPPGVTMPGPAPTAVPAR